MTDIITYCDINTCEDCPRYADDCDGDKYLDRYPTMHEYAEGKRINPKLTDLISRADAIEAVASITMSIHLSNVICDKLSALPSADAEPTVIRSKTLLPTKDFKEWAKRVRETNPNAVVIPCDAEVVSADFVKVVRCKDCRHRDLFSCPLADNDFQKDEDFCSWGERKEE